MNFGEVNRAITQANTRYPFSFAPTPLAIDSSETGHLAYRSAGGERFSVGDFANNLKVHEFMVTNRPSIVDAATLASLTNTRPTEELRLKGGILAKDGSTRPSSPAPDPHVV